ncbi:MAG TPA: hypothetical protein DHW82_00345 [Spirochaetia bacterium]|nr:MAG: hypothetical protein A2Y41_01505 [Spirochaetes bacterium GWB1_36_13]HCL55450.1 hypothetical protein [Spirochaetia bacterium]
MARKRKDLDISKKEFLSPREAGSIAGVFQTSVIYWIKKKGLKAHRSPGGHYKISKQDLLKFLDKHDIYNIDRTRKTKYRIMVIDDDKSTVDSLIEILTPDYDVSAWDFKGSLVQKTKDFAPDLIMLDIRLPNKDGFEVFNEFKSDLQTRGIPVIFLSGMTDENTVVKGLSTTAEDYIKKPFLFEEAKLRVKKILDRIYHVKPEEELD